MKTRAIALICFALSIATVPQRGIAVVPGTNGRIAFSSDRGSNTDVWTVAPDGSGAQRLTDDSGRLGSRIRLRAPTSRTTVAPCMTNGELVI